MKQLLFIAVLLTVSATIVHGETIRFRSGQVLAAEMSTAKITIANTNADMPFNIPEKPLYVVVSVKLDPMRSISVFDYALEAFGIDYKCVAINTGTRFEFTTEPVVSNKVIQLLFIANNLVVGKLPVENLKLKSKFTPRNTYDAMIPFTMRGNSKVSAISAIPAEGTFKNGEQSK